MVEKFMGPIGEPVMIILLSIPRTQLLSKFVFLYSYITAAFDLIKEVEEGKAITLKR